MSCAPVYEQPRDADIENARSILEEMQSTKTRGADRELRHQLRGIACAVARAGACLQLSDPRSPLGAMMGRANARSRERGWL